MNQMTLSLDERANIDFVLHLRRRWADTLYPELATQVQEALSNGAENIKRTMHDQPSYPWFAWWNGVRKRCYGVQSLTSFLNIPVIPH